MRRHRNAEPRRVRAFNRRIVGRENAVGEQHRARNAEMRDTRGIEREKERIVEHDPPPAQEPRRGRIGGRHVDVGPHSDRRRGSRGARGFGRHGRLRLREQPDGEREHGAPHAGGGGIVFAATAAASSVSDVASESCSALILTGSVPAAASCAANPLMSVSADEITLVLAATCAVRAERSAMTFSPWCCRLVNAATIAATDELSFSSVASIDAAHPQPGGGKKKKPTRYPWVVPCAPPPAAPTLPSIAARFAFPHSLIAFQNGMRSPVV